MKATTLISSSLILRRATFKSSKSKQSSPFAHELTQFSFSTTSCDHEELPAFYVLGYGCSFPSLTA